MRLSREESRKMRELAIQIVGDGGMHSWDNVQLAHFKCNTLKGARV